MRTTLAIDDDALEIARQVARARRVSLGEAVSELVRRGASEPVKTIQRNGLTLVALPPNSPKVAAEVVDELLEDFP